jgi:hypothetical protein
MKERAKYTERKSVRLSPRDWHLLTESGYSIREAVEYFNRMFCSSELKGLKIDLLKLEEKLKEQKLEVAKTRENIRIIKEAIENKEQTRFKKSSDNNILNKAPLTKDQCLKRLEDHYKNYKKNHDIKSIKELPKDLFSAIAKKGKLDIEEFKQLAFEKFK